MDFSDVFLICEHFMRIWLNIPLMSDQRFSEYTYNSNHDTYEQQDTYRNIDIVLWVSFIIDSFYTRM